MYFISTGYDREGEPLLGRDARSVERENGRISFRETGGRRAKSRLNLSSRDREKTEHADALNADQDTRSVNRSVDR